MRVPRTLLRRRSAALAALATLMVFSASASAQHGRGHSGHGAHGGSHHGSDRGHGSHAGGRHDAGFGFGFGFGFGTGYGSLSRYDSPHDRHGYGDRWRWSYVARHPRELGYDHLRYARRDVVLLPGDGPFLGDRYRPYLRPYGVLGPAWADLFWTSEPAWESSTAPGEPYYEGAYSLEEIARMPYVRVGDTWVRNMNYQGPEAGAATPEAPELEDFRPQPAFVRLEIHPSDASVYLDGDFLGLASELPEALAVEPGDHRLEVARPGMEASDQVFTAEPGEDLTVDARLRPLIGGGER